MSKDKVKNIIDRFTGKYDFLSNYYECEVKYDGITYNNAEAAFQSAKLKNVDDRVIFRHLSPNYAKRLGRSICLRDDWLIVKRDVMTEIIRSKFSDPNLKKKLLNTGNAILVEGNYWHDNYWGNCICDKCKDIKGKNYLGKILMKVRDEM